jgi:hypothetical protein
VDEFLADLDLVQQLCAQADFETPKSGYFPGKIARIDAEAVPVTFFELLSSVLSIDLERYHWGFSFNRIESERKAWSKIASNPHIDTDREQDYSGIIYLNSQSECTGGTQFFRHLESGLVRPPTNNEMSVVREQFEIETREDCTNWLLDPRGLHVWHPAYRKWEADLKIDMKPNRLLLFQGYHLHSAWMGERSDFVERPRYTLTFFLRERADEHPA